MPNSSAGGSRSRKAEQIFAAAKEIFMECGYGAASMDAVAARAGVSKATIYVHFANKRALFEAIIRNRGEAVFGRVTFAANVADLRQALTDLAQNFVEMMQSAEALDMYRVVLAEARQQPEVGEAFYQAGPGYGRKLVADYLFGLAERGLLDLTRDQAAIVSDLFLSMLSNEHHKRALFCLPVDQAAQARSLAAAVDLIVTRYAAKPR
jgi:TetR/AcrR family transcriptional repressor of mexJK operon